MVNKKNYQGTSSTNEVRANLRRDDTRSFTKKLSNALDTPNGTLIYFIGIAFTVATVGVFLPFSGEIGLLIAIITVLLKYNYTSRRWSAPFRVPEYLLKKTQINYKDDTLGGKTGSGQIYMGHDLETNEEIWATSNDLRTHRLVVGTTGSGKTEEIMGNIFNALALNSGSMLIDGKSDPKTFASIFRLCRLFGREEDLQVLNYIMGGRDFAAGLDSKRSNTFNPLSLGSPAMKSELMTSLLDSASAGTDMWQNRAIAFLDAIVPPLSFLADKGFLLFNAKLLCDFYLLDNIENLVWFGIFRDQNGEMINLKDGDEDYRRIYQILWEKYFPSMQLYLQNLPGYRIPTSPHKLVGMTQAEYHRIILKEKPPSMTEEEYKRMAEKIEKDEKLGDEKRREKVLEQHGYITMQLVRASGNLTFNYGHIYNDQIGEINYRDILLNRRFLLVMLPALERASQNMEQLGKMAVSSVKGVLATMLDTPLEGSYRKIIEGRPSNAKIPYFIICDEYGYYVVKGFAVAPAQGRSYGVSITFGTQDIASLSKADKAEGEATWENTNLRSAGRLNGGEESETFKKFQGAAGKAYVQMAKTADFSRSKIDNFRLSDQSSLELVDRLSIDDLAQQQDGEFHLVVGVKSKGNSGALVRRYLAFYTGDIGKTDDLRLVPYCQVKMFSDTERQNIVRNEAIASYLTNVGSEKLTQTIMDSSAYETVKNDIIAQFFSTFGKWDDLSEETVRQWVDDYDERLEQESQLNEDEDIKRDIVRIVTNNLAQSYSSSNMREQHIRCVDELIDLWLLQKKKNRQQEENVNLAILTAREKTKIAVQKIIN